MGDLRVIAARADGGVATVVRLGDALVAQGLVTATDIDQALAEQRVTGDRLGTVLVRQGAISETQLLRVLAERAGTPFVDLDDFVPDHDATLLIREPVARRMGAVGIGWDGNVLIVAMINPSDVLALDDLRVVAGADIRPMLAAPAQIHALLDRVHGHVDGAEGALRKATVATAAESAPTTRADVDDDVVVRFVNELIRRATRDRASDIHLDPTRQDVRVRFRIDGVLHDVMRVPSTLRNRTVSRVKIMASMDIADRRAAQDGRATFECDGRSIDLRVVSFPTTHGEAIVMRILDKSQSVADIDDLGFRADVLDRFKDCYRQASGAIVVTGPTGSGKSTTLHAALKDLNAPDRNIITIEDPVEHELEGIKHVQVETRAGVTFASALRSLLRADPDVLMVGEVRDTETARLAVDAALTGHLVLTSLHTKSAAATPSRLVKMGIEPYLISSAVQCVLAQRLVRELCNRCKKVHTPTRDELRRLGWRSADATAIGCAPEFFRPEGCAACSGTGYRGRSAVHEVMPLSDAIGAAIGGTTLPQDIHRIAVDEGMVPLLNDGLRKAALGLTSIEEVRRVVS